MAKPAAAGGAAAAPEKKGKKKTFKKKERKHVPHGLVHVQASFNNTIVTISDMSGNVLAWKSSGSLGFRGSRKGTPFAAQQAASNAASMARDHGVRTVDVRVSGPGSGRESAVRALAADLAQAGSLDANAVQIHLRRLPGCQWALARAE